MALNEGFQGADLCLVAIVVKLLMITSVRQRPFATDANAQKIHFRGHFVEALGSLLDANLHFATDSRSSSTANAAVYRSSSSTC